MHATYNVVNSDYTPIDVDNFYLFCQPHWYNSIHREPVLVYICKSVHNNTLLNVLSSGPARYLYSWGAYTWYYFSSGCRH